MEIRGRRECKGCARRWSYYETGSVACPSCGSLHSVGVDDRTLHTASSSLLDLSPVRDSIDEEPTRRIAGRAIERCRDFTAGYGFIDAGELLSLDDTYLAAMELRGAAGEVARRSRIDADEERYFHALLWADRGERPNPKAVPSSLRGARGLAYANATREFKSDLRTFLGEHPDPLADDALERLGDHVRRIRALDGNVPPRDAETVVEAARDIGRYLRDADETALAAAEQRLDRLA